MAEKTPRFCDLPIGSHFKFYFNPIGTLLKKTGTHTYSAWSQRDLQVADDHSLVIAVAMPRGGFDQDVADFFKQAFANHEAGIKSFAFARRCEAAYEEARKQAAPFEPSQAQIEQQMQPIVDDLLRMPYDDTVSHIKATFTGAGTPCSIALAMYKQQFKCAWDNFKLSKDIV